MFQNLPFHRNMQLLTVLFVTTVSTLAKERPFDQLRHDDRDFDEEFTKEVEIPPGNRPVPFGHISLDGFEDPTGELKQPVDALELNSRYVRYRPQVREYLKKYNISHQILRPRAPGAFLSSKNLSVDKEKVTDESFESVKVNDSVALWDIATIQQRNMFDPPRRRIGGVRRQPPAHEVPSYSIPRAGEEHNYIRKTQGEGPKLKLKTDFFNQRSFDIQSNNQENIFSTCDEFGRNAKFHPNDIVGLDWVPFYIWTNEGSRKTDARIHTFTYPTKKLVVKYKNDFGPHMNKTFNWEQPKLLLKEDIREILLIAADRKGLFDGIPYFEIPAYLKTNTNVKIPPVTIRLKTVGPYLAMMQCEQKFAYIMAVSGKEPVSEEDSKTQAARLKLKGSGFPVKRNLIRERLEAKTRKLQAEAREREKFINLEDQVDAGRGLKYDPIRDSYKNYDEFIN